MVEKGVESLFSFGIILLSLNVFLEARRFPLIVSGHVALPFLAVARHNFGLLRGKGSVEFTMPALRRSSRPFPGGFVHAPTNVPVTPRFLRLPRLRSCRPARHGFGSLRYARRGRS